MNGWLITTVETGGGLRTVHSFTHPAELFREEGKTIAFAVQVPDDCDMEPGDCDGEPDDKAISEAVMSGRRGILTFNLPEDNHDFSLACQGGSMSAAIDDHYNWLRTKIKYGSTSAKDKDICETAKQDYKQWLVDTGVAVEEANTRLTWYSDAASLMLESVKNSLYEEVRDNLSECLDDNGVTRN